MFKLELMKKKIKNTILILICIYSLFFVFGSIMAPLLAHWGYYDQSAVLTFTFSGCCHQQPDRSFWLLNYPMALCARCFGFYLGTAMWAINNLLSKFYINKILFSVMIIIILADIALNFFLHINTGNIIRFITGYLMGITFILIIDYLLTIGKMKEV